jgi:hypothetical protein
VAVELDQGFARDVAMKTKQKKISPRSKENAKALRVPQGAAESKPEALARASLQPTIQAGLTVGEYNHKAFGELSLNALVDDLATQCELSGRGDLNRTEALLTAQAHTLDSIFHALARKAQRAEYLSQLDVNLRLALKAQNQCRATLETLAAIKNPKPIAFVNQANITHGPQQVNNVVAANGAERPASDPSQRARKSENEQNKLLEHSNGQRLDTRATAPAVSADPAMAAVDTLNGPENRRR